MKIAVPVGSENKSINAVGSHDCGCKSGIKLTDCCEVDATDVVKQSSESCCHHHDGDHDHHHGPGHVCKH